MPNADSNTPTSHEQSSAQHAVILHRVVRFEINPTTTGLGRYYELAIACQGTPDQETGYLVDIHAIDDLVRTHLIPIINAACQSAPEPSPASLLPQLWAAANANFNHPIVSLTWQLTPMKRIEMNTTTASDHFVFRQRYEFSASHRLHSEKLSPETNRQVFGKCNNPNGHGHNYTVEPTLTLPINDHTCTHTAVDSIVEEFILAKLDHKHLNADCPSFDQTAGGVMPSVENIAKYCYQQLQAPAGGLADGAELVSITVWETDRTSCTYPATI
ncbi:MAG: 6-carboxytetrahydropterin synthase [Phycisphaerales bacterium]|nr:6-carboxytetrahydropterin synthase [Phycisphaerales bacterium]